MKKEEKDKCKKGLDRLLYEGGRGIIKREETTLCEESVEAAMAQMEDEGDTKLKVDTQSTSVSAIKLYVGFGDVDYTIKGLMSF